MGHFNFKPDGRPGDQPDDQFEASPLSLFIGSLTTGESRAFDGFGRATRSQAKAPHRGLSMAPRPRPAPLVIHTGSRALAFIVGDSTEEMYVSKAPIAR